MKALAKSVRKRPPQQELFRRGEKRKRAGRKSKSWRAGSPHKTRPEIKPHHALHVVMRVVSAVGSMRRRKLYKAIRDATIIAALREWIRIVHISIQRTHIHMLVEAENKLALARGMQGFQISAAKHINAAIGAGLAGSVVGKVELAPERDAFGTHRVAIGANKVTRRRGQVFADRYHLEVITSPTQARRALSYVLNNWRKHREDQRGLPATWLVDPFSSGIMFAEWKELDGKPWMWPIKETYDPLMVRRPRSWLLSDGWKLLGEISARDAPGA